MRYLFVLQSIYIFWKEKRTVSVIVTSGVRKLEPDFGWDFYFKDYHLFYFTFSPNYSLSR